MLYMAFFTFPFFHQRFFDNEGNPLAGGSLTFYSAGSTALKDIYLDQSGSPAPNPMPLDSTGVPQHQYFAGEGEYDIVIKNANGANIQKVLRITCTGGSSSPFPDPANPGFLHWDGSTYEWIELPMYPTPGNSGYLHYDAGTQTYAWVAVPVDDHKVANSDTDAPGYLKDKIVDSSTVKWSEVIVDGNSVITAQTVDLDKVPAVVVWTILKDTDPQTPDFGLTHEDLNTLAETGFGVAAQMVQTNIPGSALSVWYFKGTYWGDGVWEEAKMPVDSCITNMNKSQHDYLHTHPESWPETNPSNYPAGIYSCVMIGDGYFWQQLVIPEYPDPSYNITSFLKYDASGKVFVWLDASLLEAKPIGPAGGDLYGYYPDPIVRQLTGVGTSLVNMDVQGQGHASGPGISGFTYGRGCTPGFIYKGGNHVAAWIAQSSNGDMYISTDHFQKATKDTSLSANSTYTSTADYGYGAQCLYYGKVNKTDTHNSWIVFKQSFHGIFYIPDVSASYNTNGTFVQSAWVKLSNSNIMDSIAHAVQTNDGGVLLTAAYMNGVTYYADLAGTGSVHYMGEEISGIATDSYGTYMVVARNSGKLYKNTSETTSTFNNAAWTLLDSAAGLVIDGTAVDHLPITGSGGGLNQTWWAGMGCAYGLWVVTVALKHESTDPIYAYSDNGLEWTTYGGPTDAVITTWDMKSDGVYWFGCPTNQPLPLVYQILVNSIPAHKRLICEKGLMVAGDTFLADLPNAPALGTDENGKIIAGQGAIAQIGNAPKTDYAFSPYTGGRLWVPNDKASGPVEALMGALVRDEVNHTITVPAYTVQLFDNADFLGQPLRYNVAQTTFTLTTSNVTQYVYARYISPGVAQTILTPFVEDINFSSSFPLFIVERINYTDGSSRIHQVGFDTLGEGLAQKTNKMMIETVPYRRTTAGGLMIGSSALQVTLTGAVVYAGVVPHTIAAYNSSTDKLFHAYKVAGNWTYAVESAGTVNNSQYQNGNDLASLGTNKYKNVWIYRSIGDDKECFYVDSTAQYNTLSDALADGVPANLPDIINWHCMLVGRIAMQNGQTSGYTTQSAFINAFNVVTGSSGNFIRNQANNGTNDAPGNIFLDPAATINIRYEDTGTPANNITWLSASKDMLKLQALDINVPTLIGYQAELTPSALALRGRPGTSYGIYNAAAIITREQFSWVPNVNGAWYTFNHQDLGGGTAQAQGGYSFPRLRLRISPTDTVSAELVNKIVDSNGNELAQVTHGSYGQALQIPTTIIAGTPNAQQLFDYSISEGDPHPISQAGTDSGNNYGNRGFAFVAASSRTMTKGRMMITQTGGSWMRMGIYDSNGTLISKSNRVAVASGMIWFPFITPVSLVGGNVYYLAYWCDDTTGNLKFPCISGRATYNYNPLPQVYDINNEMPNTLGTSGTATQYRPWMMISE